MSQVSSKLRKAGRKYSHYCPGCDELHAINVEPPSPVWSFNGNLTAPTFSPSVKIEGKQIITVLGKWTGEWVLGPDGKALDYCCHYFLQAGNLVYLNDCTHSLVGKTVPLPDLPEGYVDPC